MKYILIISFFCFFSRNCCSQNCPPFLKEKIILKDDGLLLNESQEPVRLGVLSNIKNSASCLEIRRYSSSDPRGYGKIDIIKSEKDSLKITECRYAITKLPMPKEWQLYKMLRSGNSVYVLNSSISSLPFNEKFIDILKSSNIFNVYDSKDEKVLLKKKGMTEGEIRDLFAFVSTIEVKIGNQYRCFDISDGSTEGNINLTYLKDVAKIHQIFKYTK